jgi:hypothetical protein
VCLAIHPHPTSSLIGSEAWYFYATKKSYKFSLIVMDVRGCLCSSAHGCIHDAFIVSPNNCILVYETLMTNRSMHMRKEAIGRTYHHDTALSPWRLERGVEEKSRLGQRARG